MTGELTAEFLGTFIMILFGVGAAAQVLAGRLGSQDSIAWAWGIKSQGIGQTWRLAILARLSPRVDQTWRRAPPATSHSAAVT
jgi:glycerol uptake facilitator protein